MRPGTPELHAEAAQVVAFAAVAMIEARHIHVLAADAVVVMNFAADEFRREPAHGEANLFGQIAANDVGRIADAVGETGANWS